MNIAAILLTVIGAGGFLVMPVLLGAAVADLGLDDAQVGQLGAGIMAGSAVAAILASALVRAASWRVLCVGGLVLQVVGQVAAAQFEYGAALWMAVLVASLGGGSVYSFALTILGDQHNSAKLFGYSVTSQVAFQVVGMSMLSWFTVDGGFAACVYVLAATGMLGLLLCVWLPAERVEPPKLAAEKTPLLKQPLTLLALAGCFFFFANVGALWAYIERIGSLAGFAADELGPALAGGVAVGMAGSLSAAWQGARWGDVVPLSVATALTVVALLLLTPDSSLAPFVAGLALYNFAWNYSLTFQYETVARADGSGRAVAAAPAFHSIGGAVGPAVASVLITGSAMLAVNVIAGVCVVLSLLAFLPAARK